MISFVDEFWSALGGPPELLDSLSVNGDGDLPSAYRVTDLAVASIGVAGLAAAELAGVESDAAPAVTVDRALASTWFGSAVEPDGWTLSSVWDPLARNYRARDGWIRLHTNAPNHRDAAIAVLGVAADYVAVRRAVAGWAAGDLEEAIVAAGGCASMMRSHDEWLRHPQGAAVSREPLFALALGRSRKRREVVAAHCVASANGTSRSRPHPSDRRAGRHPVSCRAGGGCAPDRPARVE